MNEGDSQALFSVTAVSTTIVSLYVFLILFIIEYLEVGPALENRYFTILIMAFIGIFNHYYFVRHKQFLKFNFRKDKLGGWVVTFFVITTFVLVLIGAKINREKIFRERKVSPHNYPQKESLEGKIRKYFE